MRSSWPCPSCRIGSKSGEVIIESLTVVFVFACNDNLDLLFLILLLKIDLSIH
ncbi:hypothetical protein MOUN0_F00980 [Monosporozyma unispora]